MASKKSRWVKLPRGITWESVREIMREKRRKQTFVRNLKYGKAGTDDPGPH